MDNTLINPLRAHANAPLASGLYVVATPIGNLGDLTFRGADVLSRAALIACEDTRITKRLLDAYGVTTTMAAYHEHNAATVRPKLIDRLSAGDAIALVTDAGAPGVSDPGFRLVRAVREAALPIHSVPGPSALTAAISLAPVAADKHVFLGFPPNRSKARRGFLESYRNVDAGLILYESPHRTGACLADLHAVMGDREAAVLRELTKRFEEVRTGALSELARLYDDAPPKGEVVIAVGPPIRSQTPIDVRALLSSALAAGLSAKEAAAEAAEATGRPRRDFYDEAVALAKAR